MEVGTTIQEVRWLMDMNSMNLDKMDMNKVGDVLQKINFAAGKQAEETFKMIMEKVLDRGIMPKEALRIGDDTMEAIYTQAYNLYNQGRYKEASYIFRLLMLLDFSTPKFTLGLAACLHRMKDYINASNLYLLCAALDQKNPMPHYHSADCYLQMGMNELAILALGMAVTTAGEQPQYAILRERASLLKKSLEDQFHGVTTSTEEPKKEAPKEQAKTKKAA